MSVAVPAKKRRRPSVFRQIFAAIQLLILSVIAVGLVFTAVTIFMDENREYIPLHKVPKDLRNATIATEDKRFYDHNGVDFRGIGRALVEDVKTGARSQGGSTITQQLVRNVYLTQRKSMGRKIQELLLAVQIERKYSKDEILEKYLNQVFYGSGAYGVQAAARTYFGKRVEKLTLAECALIAGLPQRPTGYSPYKSMKLAKQRRDTVLALMAQEGYITEAQKEKAQATPIDLAYSRPSGARIRRAPYFVDYVLDDLVDRYGANMVYKGGLRIYTTLMTNMQAVADKAVKDGVKRMEDQHVSQGALVSIDPRTGYIRAMVGGVDYKKSQLNRANLVKHPRSPGSSFKPFVYSAAFENGLDPYDTVTDEPIAIDDGSRRPWTPGNYDGKWYGTITVQTAIAQSRNIPAIKTIQKFGIDKAIEMAHRCGIQSPLGHNLSLAIGTSGVTALELCSAYSTFANDGVHADPLAILKVTDRAGNVIEMNKPIVRRVLKSDVEGEIDACLRAVTTQGTARAVGRAIEDSRGKTGTTQDDRDAWFTGYVPGQLATVVWVGNDDNSKMRHVFGGTGCAPIWIDFMQDALRMNPKVKSVPKPETNKVVKAGSKEERDLKRKERQARRARDKEGTPAEAQAQGESDTVRVRLCGDTGLLATSACPSTYVETFTRGEEPTEACNLHPGKNLNESDRRTASRRSHGRARVEKTPFGTISSQNESGGETSAGDDSNNAAASSDSAPAEETAHPDRMVRVTLCVESGLRATRYCPETIQRRLPESEVPSGYCTLHGPR
jgi:penicillin-binding protein 1A